MGHFDSIVLSLACVLTKLCPRWKIPLENLWKCQTLIFKMSLDASGLKNLCLCYEFQSRLLFIFRLLLRNFLTALYLQIKFQNTWPHQLLLCSHSNQGNSSSSAHTPTVPSACSRNSWGVEMCNSYMFSLFGAREHSRHFCTYHIWNEKKR